MLYANFRMLNKCIMLKRGLLVLIAGIGCLSYIRDMV